MAIVEYYGTGKRKSSTARVRLLPGAGQVTINKRDLNDYFKSETQRTVIRYPLAVTDNLGKFDIKATVDPHQGTKEIRSEGGTQEIPILETVA
jgi:small subunit ribosomal protein S9